MRFERIRYLDWAKRRFEENPPRFNLASSGMEPAAAAELGLGEGEPLRLSGPNAFGHPGMRERLGAMHGVPPSHVLVASGTSQANFLVASALLRPGELALCEWPAYEPLWRVLEALGARVEWIARDAANGYAPDPARVQDGFARGARMLLLSDLHNPTGALLERSLVRELARIAERHDGWLVVDEVYLSGVFDRRVETAVSLGERVIVTSSLTKTYGLGPLRAGWAIAPPELVTRANHVRDYVGAQGPFIAEELAIRALDRLEALGARARRRREETWPLVRDFAESHGLEMAAPAGGFIAWIRLPGGLDSDAFNHALSTRHDTLVVPGAFFGVPDHIRVSYGASREIVAEGLRRIGLALDEAAAR